MSVAAELAKEAGETLLIDADPQGSASGWIGPDALDAELANVLSEQETPENAIVRTAFPRLSILPTAGLGGGLKAFSEGPALQKPFCMKNLIRHIETLGYLYTVIDLSPGWGSIERAALIASNEVITPILGDSFATDGLEIFADNLRKLRKDMDSRKPEYRRVILNAVDGRIKQHLGTLKAIRENAGSLKIYTVPVDPAFRLAQRTGLTLQALAAIKNETREAIHAVALDLIKQEY